MTDVRAMNGCTCPSCAASTAYSAERDVQRLRREVEEIRAEQHRHAQELIDVREQAAAAVLLIQEQEALLNRTVRHLYRQITGEEP